MKASIAAQVTAWRNVVAKQPGGLLRWDEEFLKGLLGFPKLCERQAAILKEIAARALTAPEIAAIAAAWGYKPGWINHWKKEQDEDRAAAQRLGS